MGSRLRAFLLLTRVSLAPSACVDALVGVSLGCAGYFPGWAVLLKAAGASLCVFLGGMALNDWADRAADAKDRPERPIPAGLVKAPEALAFALTLLALGVGLGFWTNPLAGACLLAVAACAAAYDLVLRGPTLGPMCLALCRAGNLTFGILAVRAESGLPWSDALLLPPIAYGLYVGLVSILSGYEDGARSLQNAKLSGLVTYCAVLLAILPLTAMALRPQPEGWAYLLGLGISLSAASGLWLEARRPGPWTQARVGKTMGMSLRRLMPATASVACTVLNDTLFPWMVVAVALLGLKVSHRLRRAFPPT
ncbi:MAG: UbiA family prenyltransferase [Planctomycetes bacterium]|nr:UbiA family prenyltransferase [Planctomycetota bacterium]